METRVQVAYHFKIDPAQLLPGSIRLPEQITRTITVGEEIIPAKVSIDCLPAADRAALMAEIDKQTREATRTARPAGSLPQAAAGGLESDDEEMSAF